MQLKQISLYGKNKERRDVEFNLSQVNILTGASKKGKSSLIDIVEYCLGSSECNVAEGYIKQTVKWYSILLQFADTKVFIARAAPLQGLKSSTACYMLVAKDIQIPDYSDLENSTNIDSVVNFLTSKIGIPEQITEVSEEHTRPKIQVGFKHSRYYLFQGQDEVAAKRTLFHRQSEPFIPQAIKDTLPYFMGAAEDNRLSDLEQLRNLKRQKRKLQKSIAEIESIRGDGLTKGYQLLAEATSVGLHDETIIVQDDALLDVLEKLTSWQPTEDDDDSSIDDVAYQLDRTYRDLKEKKKVIRSRIRSATDYEGSASGFENELNQQHLRLQSIGLYKKINSSNICPMCDSVHDEFNNTGNIVKQSIVDLESKLKGVTRNKPRITTYLSDLRNKDGNLAQEIKNVRNSINLIKKQQDDLNTKASLDDKRSRVIGRISLYLESIDWNKDTATLSKKLDDLIPQIEELEQQLDPDALKERLEAQLSCVAEDMTKWARELNLEHSEHPIRLGVSQLTVVAETAYGRIPLYRMGSGENWVGYHLVTYLALAKWFIEQARPVGRFIFFDQPTQVYFPSDKVITGDIEEISDDEDRQAVKRMFEWVYKIVTELSPNLQVIITDHADIDEDWFQDLVIDTKWRGDNALIPKHWYE